MCEFPAERLSFPPALKRIILNDLFAALKGRSSTKCQLVTSHMGDRLAFAIRSNILLAISRNWVSLSVVLRHMMIFAFGR